MNKSEAHFNKLCSRPRFHYRIRGPDPNKWADRTGEARKETEPSKVVLFMLLRYLNDAVGFIEVSLHICHIFFGRSKTAPLRMVIISMWAPLHHPASNHSSFGTSVPNLERQTGWPLQIWQSLANFFARQPNMFYVK